MGTCLIGAMTGLLNVTMPSLTRGGFGGQEEFQGKVQERDGSTG